MRLFSPLIKQLIYLKISGQTAKMNRNMLMNNTKKRDQLQQAQDTITQIANALTAEAEHYLAEQLDFAANYIENVLHHLYANDNAEES
jgi:prephenate dehydrogenase